MRMFNKVKSSFKNFVAKVSVKKLDEKFLDEYLFGLELELLQCNVAPLIVDELIKGLRSELLGVEVEKKKVERVVKSVLKRVVLDKLVVGDLVVSGAKPFIVLVLGFNGVGKTTTIAKLVKFFQDQGLSVVVGAGDTYRAASIEQLQEHCDFLGVKLVKHKYGGDPAAVGFDAVQHAKAKGLDVVLIDTAGRSYENKNLMDELVKVCRVVKPSFKILVVDALTGGSVVDQVKRFDEVVGVDGLIITKVDSDTKGGTVISAPLVLGKPLLFLGTGQGYNDLEKPLVEELLNQIF